MIAVFKLRAEDNHSELFQKIRINGSKFQEEKFP